ncbi:MAG TPA: DCC1-like thiol-disulfide oxidoreductase family protein [Burkholderiales bacterium]|nr:DCC1-like thiol-disulfide oxidoreductase family protein [Burkholderiales bacterium]
MTLESTPYSYRTDSNVPRFPDDGPLIVFDGLCIFCSAFIKMVLRHDRREAFRFVLAQSALGQALYQHYRLDTRVFETNLVIVDGRVYTKLDAFVQVAKRLALPWRLLAVVQVLPRFFADRLYDVIARNRYRLFGRTDHCMVPPQHVQTRFLE